MNKKEYEKPEISIIELSVNDAICVSDVVKSNDFKDLFGKPDEEL